MTDYEKIKAAAEYICARVSARPTMGLVLGSGLGGYADTLEDAVRISYSEIPNFPVPTIPGHSGALVFGKKCGREVVVLQGRIHYYEGLPQREITLPIRVLAALGVLLVVSAYFALQNVALPASKANFPVKVLVIDPGHGGVDGGAVSIDGSRESDINLSIGNKLNALAQLFGIDTLMTRSSDKSSSSRPAGADSEHSSNK